MMMPVRTTLQRWASSLIIDFPDDNVPILTNAEDWKKWGNMLIQEKSFSDNAAPGPNAFSEWQPWAFSVFKAMSNF